MKILITGGNGYIGTNFWNLFHSSNKITICDIADGFDQPYTKAEELPLEEIEKYDGIIHLAALSGIMACEENYMDAIVKNLLTANNIFSKAAMRNIPVVFTSSQAAKDPLSSKYANLKNQCEEIAELYGTTYIIRLSNVYGGDEYLSKKETVVKQFITKYRNNEPMEVHGSGGQERDFIHVLDVCEAMMRILSLLPDEKTPMDIGTGKGTSIQDVIKMFPRKENQHYEFIDGRSSGAESSIADTRDAENRIYFKAERQLEDYIKEMIK